MSPTTAHRSGTKVLEFDPAHIAALKRRCDAVSAAAEGAITYLLLAGLRLPEGCSPAVLDALLCLGERDNYATRLFFAERSSTSTLVTLNWNANGVRILERNWHAFSWKVPMNPSPEHVLLEHLKPL